MQRDPLSHAVRLFHRAEGAAKNAEYARERLNRAIAGLTEDEIQQYAEQTQAALDKSQAQERDEHLAASKA